MYQEIKGYSPEKPFQYPSNMPYVEIFGKREPEFKYYFETLRTEDGDFCFLRNKETGEKSLIPSLWNKGIGILEKTRILQILTGSQYTVKIQSILSYINELKNEITNEKPLIRGIKQ